MIIPVDQLAIQFLFTQYSLRRLLYDAYPQLPPYHLLIPLNTILQSPRLCSNGHSRRT
jgi:hypothetical protein